MENETVSTEKHSNRDQFVKLVIGTAAGFIAAKVVEGAYDSLIVNRRRNTVVTQD